jgi:hypothetical protein
MGEMPAGGWIVDAVIAITIAEVLALAAYRRLTGRGPALRDLLPNVGAGLFLMLALRSVLVGVAWPWLALCLAGAGLAHLADLLRRWPRP